MAEELFDASDKAILILNIHGVDDLSIISAPIAAAATRTRTRLLIIIYCTFFDDAAGSDSWDVVQKLLTHAYVQATAVSQKYNKILMCVDVLLRGFSSSATDEPIIDDWNVVFYSGTFLSFCSKNRIVVIISFKDFLRRFLYPKHGNLCLLCIFREHRILSCHSQTGLKTPPFILWLPSEERLIISTPGTRSFLAWQLGSLERRSLLELQVGDACPLAHSNTEDI